MTTRRFSDLFEAYPLEVAVSRDAGIIHHAVDRSGVCGQPRAAVEAGLMVAGVSFIGAAAGAVGEGLRLFVVAGIVGDDGDVLALEREADRLPDAAAAAGDDCDACHENSPTQIVRPD